MIPCPLPSMFRLDPLEPRVLLARPDPSPAENVYFRLPLSSDTSVHYYFDRNGSAPGVEVWNGTNQSYDGHTGTDFSGGPRGRPVFAAAPGILIGKDDGHPDYGGPPNGNYVRINHGNDRLGRSIRTVYLHLEAGTVTTKPIGSFIAAGEQIGGVGTSGNSTGLHLHFHTMIGGEAFDPYRKIGSSEVSWWTNQGSGAPSTVAQPNKFVAGDLAEVYELSGSQLNVRAAPAGTAIGSKPNGAVGTVLEGPVWAAFNGDIANSLWVWYRIRWSDGLEGWSTHNWLRRFIDTVPPTVTGSEFLLETAPLRMTVSFSENVGPSLSTGDFVVTNLTTGGTTAPTVSYNSTTNVATLNFGGVLADGNYRLRVIAAGVHDPAGNPMTQDYFSDFFILAGDANRDRVVNMGDFSILAARFNQPATFSQGDFNYNGLAEIGDFGLLASRFNTSLPAPGDLPRTQTTLPMQPGRTGLADPPADPRSQAGRDLLNELL
ncbi:MAG: peptidoglycan DD-metalloendopeptidase family protein [Phycisphaerae bacterium]|nr:peptidoglycan DD-metalloendopeptidase family protein [Phycisphaerae bacterium]